MGLSRLDLTTISRMIASKSEGLTDSTPIGPTPQELEALVTTIVGKAIDDVFGDDEKPAVIDVPVIDVGGRGVIDVPPVTAAAEPVNDPAFEAGELPPLADLAPVADLPI